MRRRARGLRAAAGLLVLVGLACGGARDEAQEAGQGHAAAAVAAPDFTLPDLDGRPVSLASFRGRLVLIDFWATWCVPCIFQIPVLNAFYETYRADGVVVLGVSVDAGAPESVAAFAAEQDIRYPVLLGSESLAWSYGVPGFPALAVVDRQGRIDSLHVGVVEREELEALVARLVAPSRAAAAEGAT